MIYALTNSKGGVGKTTIAVHLAAHLAGKGRKIIFVDADVQGSSSPWIKQIQKESKLPIRLERLADPRVIIEKVSGLAEEGDDLVIDGPAGLSDVTRAIMLRADRIYLPCGPSALDLRAADLAVKLLKEAQRVRKGAPKAGLIPNKLQKRGRLSAEMLSTLGTFNIKTLSGLSLRQSFADAAGQGTVVSRMGFSAKLASREMNNLMKEMTHG